MNKINLNEGLEYNDMDGQIFPNVTVDEYAAKIGKDSDIVTLSFTVKSEEVGNDLVEWFERGYDFVLDASLSEGEVDVGKYLVFVEMNRRTSVPKKIIELLSDLKTLTSLKVDDWTVSVENKDYKPDEKILKQVIVLSPGEYRQEKEREEELNEMRLIANLDTKKVYDETEDIKVLKSIAGL